MMLQLRNASRPAMPFFRQVTGLPSFHRPLIRGSLSRLSRIIVVPLSFLSAESSRVSAESVSHPAGVSNACHRTPAKPCVDSRVQAVIYTSASSWKLSRANTGNEGESTVSIMRTADTLRSDPDFAGLMVRCAAQGKIDVLIVLVTPLPPKSRPRVTVAAGGQTISFDGTMAAAGAAVVLPQEAGLLAGGPWQSQPALTISVADGGNQIKGSVALDGLGTAYSNLIGSCSR